MSTYVYISAHSSPFNLLDGKSMSLKTSQPVVQSGVRVLIVTMDTHLNSAVKRSIEALKKICPRITLKICSATEYTNDPKALERCRDEIAKADIIFVGMLFLENQYGMSWVEWMS